MLEPLFMYLQKTFFDLSFLKDIYDPNALRNVISRRSAHETLRLIFDLFSFDQVCVTVQLVLHTVDLPFFSAGLMYHPHLRPLTTPIATILSASSELHQLARRRSSLPTPSDAVRALGNVFSSRSPRETLRPASEGAVSEVDGSPLNSIA